MFGSQLFWLASVTGPIFRFQPVSSHQMLVIEQEETKLIEYSNLLSVQSLDNWKRGLLMNYSFVLQQDWSPWFFWCADH